jgi:hypothetical protein
MPLCDLLAQKSRDAVHSSRVTVDPADIAQPALLPKLREE